MINIVLYQPEIPANTGNIIRSASSLGAKVHIIKPISFSLEDKDFKRSSMDYADSCDIRFYESLDDFFQKNDTEEIYFITRYGQNIYSHADFSNKFKNIFIMFGKESSGLPHDLLRKNKNRCLRIPMRPEARSLNLSNSVAIIAYEIARQQDFFTLASFETIKGMDFLENEELKNEN